MRYNRGMNSARIFAIIGIIVFLYYATYYLYTGIINPIPGLGDSWDYHIPISRMILDGSFVVPQHVKLPQWYYPGSGEAINAVLIFLGIPLTLSNLIAVFCLFFICWKLGGVFKLTFYESLFFATTIVTLNVFVRWYNAVSVDVWLVNFFLLGIILLERPRESLRYALFLGFVLGMLIGSKLSGWYYLIMLSIIYGKSFLVFASFKKVIIFLIPFSVFGLFWYMRNAVLFLNPFYPIAFLSLPMKMYFPVKLATIVVSSPRFFFDSLIAEYKLWMFVIPLAIFMNVRQILAHSTVPAQIIKLSLLAIFSFAVFLASPSEYQAEIVVSSFRYSYPAFVLLILLSFIIAKRYHKMEILSILSIASMMMVTSFLYYPKLVFIYAPLSLMVSYLLHRYEKNLERLFA